MIFNTNYSLPSILDVAVYATEFTLLVGIILILLHFTFISTTIKYLTVIEYSSKVSLFVLSISQFFNIYNFTLFNESDFIVSFYGSFLLSKEIIFFKIIIIFLAMLILIVSENYIKETKIGYFEYNILFLSSVFGCLITLSSNDLLTLYISLEIQALAFYIMATMKKSATSSEAGLKYFIIGSFSSALLLFGISLVVLFTGHHGFENISLFLHFSGPNLYGIEFGILLIIVALLVKLAIAPFHEWVADVYEGITTPTALFFATIPKISTFFVLSRLVHSVFFNLFELVQPLLLLASLLSLIFGCLNAFKQQNIKRFLAFSSVNHFGFILIGLVVGTKSGVAASFLYLSFYIILTFGMWSSLILLTYVKPVLGSLRVYQLTRLTELGGLINSNPGIALSIFLLLISMGGIPPLAGFNAKVSIFYSLISVLNSYNFNINFGLNILLVVGLLSSILSVYYYIRIIKILTFVSKVQPVNSNIIFKFSKNNIGLYLLAIITMFNIFSFILFLS